MKINLDQAIDKIQKGKVIGIPTETVYGVATSYTNEEGVKEIFALKRRAFTNPMSLLVSDQSQLNSVVKTYSPHCLDMMKQLWPGPLTLVLPAKETVLPIIRAGGPTIGVRIPDNESALTLIRETGPLVCTSANLSGRPSPTTIAHVEEDFGRDFPILGSLPAKEGIESTVLAFKNAKWVILRLGVLKPDDFLPILGYRPEILREAKLSSTQYKPNAKVHLGLPPIEVKEPVIIGFEEGAYSEIANVYTLGSLHDLRSCQKNLYAVLRDIDAQKISNVFVDTNFSHTGSGELLWERFKDLND